MKKEYCFSIAIESEEPVDTVRGTVVLALHKAGFEYMSIKDIPAEKHWPVKDAGKIEKPLTMKEKIALAYNLVDDVRHYK